MPTLIQYLPQQQIDKQKWDACIAGATNGLLYGCSFYLDHMAKHWDGLVLNDYEAVMPLTWNKKWGIRYLYQPFLCASLGIFGKHITTQITKDFLLSIPAIFRYIDINLNYGNSHNPGIAEWYERKNYLLDLGQPYGSLYNKFSDSTRRNIKKALQNGCVVSKPAFNEVLQLAKTQLKEMMTVSHDDFNRIASLYAYLQQKNSAVTYGIAAADGKLLASCIFFLWQNRAYYILVGNAAASKRTGASHALLNAFIKDYAEKNMLLDFEGSDIPGMARFYSSFGATEENYPAIKINRLPALIKWLKK